MFAAGSYLTVSANGPDDSEVERTSGPFGCLRVITRVSEELPLVMTTGPVLVPTLGVDRAMVIAELFESDLSRGLGQRDGRRSWRHHCAFLCFSPYLEVDNCFAALIAKCYDPSSSNRGQSTEVWGAELASNLNDVPVVSNPLAQHRVEVGELEVPHTKRTWIAGTSSGIVVHVNRNELVVNRGKPIPGMEAGHSFKRRYFLAYFNLH